MFFAYLSDSSHACAQVEGHSRSSREALTRQLAGRLGMQIDASPHVFNSVVYRDPSMGSDLVLRMDQSAVNRSRTSDERSGASSATVATPVATNVTSTAATVAPADAVVAFDEAMGSELTEAQALLECVHAHASMAERLLLPALFHTAEYHNQWLHDEWSWGLPPHGRRRSSSSQQGTAPPHTSAHPSYKSSAAAAEGKRDGVGIGGQPGQEGQQRHPVGSFVEVTDGRAESHTRALEVTAM